jgi:NAD(P)-dependent dehydrogenase (short-subunit alcohol dehydrogenase family)
VEELHNRIIAIVGGSSGVGLATAEKLAGHGGIVVVMARGKERLDQAVLRLEGRAVAVAMDAADPASVRRAFAEVGRRFGKLDALLNVAGVARPIKIADATDDDIAYVMGINFLGPIYTTRSAIPLLKAAGGGDIVNVSSEITLDALPFMTLYGASKGGLEVFSRMMNRELKPEGIRVSTVVLGRTDTEFSSANIGDADQMASMRAIWDADGYSTRISGLVPMDRESVAEALLFLVTRPPGQMLDVMHVRSFR